MTGADCGSRRMTGAQYVFGYGSLLERSAPAAERDAPARQYHLHGYRRGWGVAMENRSDIPSYKYYLLENGERPDVFVVFLNIQSAIGERVNGALLAVDSSDIAEFDLRERNYDRVDVTAHVEPPVAGTVWTYVGGPDAVARFQRGLREGRAIIDQNYLEHVRRGFATLGEAALSEYEALTEPPLCPTVALRRIDRKQGTQPLPTVPT